MGFQVFVIFLLSKIARQTVHTGLTSYRLAAFILRFRVVTERLINWRLVTTMLVWQMQLDFSCKSSDLRGIDVDENIGEYATHSSVMTMLVTIHVFCRKLVVLLPEH